MNFAVGHWVQISHDDAYVQGRILGIDALGNWVIQYYSGRQEHVNRNAAERIMQHDYCCPLPAGFKMQHNEWAR